MGQLVWTLLLLLLMAAQSPQTLVSGWVLIAQIKKYDQHVPAECLAKRSCAIYKPRGVLSAAADAVHPTLTGLMVAAGVQPLQGHVGRLDILTSGLILVTDDCALHEGAVGLVKRYSLLVAGQHTPVSDAITSLAQPLEFTRKKSGVIHSDAAGVYYRRSFLDSKFRKTGGLLDQVGGLQVDKELARVSALLGPGRDASGVAQEPCSWVTEVEVEIRQGRHHQIRRLCKRAGLELIHLRRVAIGPLSLQSLQLQLGEVRELSEEDKRKLYSACLPSILPGCERRAASARVADDRARRRALRKSFRSERLSYKGGG